MLQHAGHRSFDKLLWCGVRMFEYPHTLLHQKVMTIDSILSAVGSSNFDDRSFETNDELTLGILDAALARRLDSIFERYAARADEMEQVPLQHGRSSEDDELDAEQFDCAVGLCRAGQKRCFAHEARNELGGGELIQRLR